MVATSTLALLLRFTAPEAGSVPIEWSAPETCPDASSVRQRLDRALADAPAATRTELSAAAMVTGGPHTGFELSLRLTSDGGEAVRTLTSTDCGELAHATVLIVALAADPTVLDRGVITAEPVPEPKPEPEPEPEPEPRVPEAPDSTIDLSNDAANDAASNDGRRTVTRDTRRRRSSPERPTRRRPERPPLPPRDPKLHVGLRVVGGVGLAVLPSPTADISVAATVWRKLWRVELGFTYWTPVELSASGPLDVRGRFQLWAFEPRGCFVPGVRAFEFPLCAGLDLGAIHGAGEGTDLQAQSRVAGFVSAALGGGLVVRPKAINERRLGFWLRGEALPALGRARFETSGMAVVHRTPPIGGRVGAGIEVRLR